MSALRTLVGRFAALALCGYLLGVIALPIEVLAAPDSTADCTCPGGDDAMCPMHHHGSTTTSRCAIGAAPDLAAAMPLAIGAPVRQMVGIAVPAPLVVERISFDIDPDSVRQPPPDPPPPRA